MKLNFKRLFLSTLIVGLLAAGTNGLKEATLTVAKADNSYYVKKHLRTFSRSQLVNEIKLTSDANRGPSFTFLIHGIGGNAGHWSNSLSYDSSNPDNYGVNGGTAFSYNINSIISKIKQHYDAEVYVATPANKTSDDFSFTKYDTNYSYYGDPYYSINSSASNFYSEKVKHCIIVYNSNDGGQGFDYEFGNFENIANRLALDFKYVHGYVPKINLIGHSRGGLVAQAYANKYPRNVTGIYTLGTPFLGSRTGKLLEDLPGLAEPLDLQSTIDSAAYQDLQVEQFQNNLKNNWNIGVQSQNPAMRALAYGSVITVPFLRKVLLLAKNTYSIDTGNAYVNNIVTDILNQAVELITDINDILAPNAGSVDFDKVIPWLSYNNSTSISNSQKNSIRNLIKNFIQTYLKNKFNEINAYSSGFLGVALDLLRSIPAVNFLVTLADFTGEAIITSYINRIIDMMTSYQGKIGIFNDDVLVGIDSAMCLGYENYARYVRVFDEKCLSYDNLIHLTTNQLPVGHNLETCDNYILNNIIGNSIYADFSGFFNGTYADSPISTFDPSDRNNCCDLVAETCDEYIMDMSVIQQKWGYADNQYPAINPNIKIENRTRPLTIRMSHLNVFGGNGAGGHPETDSFIQYIGNDSFDLKIIYNDYNEFRYKTDFNSQSFAAAFQLPNVNVTFEAANEYSSLSITGANGKNGSTGNSYGTAVGVIGNTRNGKNGTNGGKGGNGSRGCTALNCESVDFTKATKITLIGGNGGKGGNGGTGGNGANGTVADFGCDGGHGGDGGNGGNGGTGGASGYALVATSLKLGSKSLEDANIVFKGGHPGDGGNSGNAGNGGNGASATWNIFSWNHKGGNGGDGGVIGYAGNCGNVSNPISVGNTSGNFSSSSSNIIRQYFAYGGKAASKFGNGGNAGSGTGSGSRGVPGVAVEGPTNLHNLVPGHTGIVAGFSTNYYTIFTGRGYYANGDPLYTTEYPTYGACGN